MVKKVIFIITRSYNLKRFEYINIQNFLKLALTIFKCQIGK